MIAAAGPRPYRVCPGRVGRARAGGRGSGRAVAEPTGARDGATQWGASPRRETRRERDAEPRRLRVRLQAHHTTGLPGTD
jgi:hypothetical protein